MAGHKGMGMIKEKNYRESSGNPEDSREVVSFITRIMKGRKKGKNQKKGGGILRGNVMRNT